MNHCGVSVRARLAVGKRLLPAGRACAPVTPRPVANCSPARACSVYDRSPGEARPVPGRGVFPQHRPARVPDTQELFIWRGCLTPLGQPRLRPGSGPPRVPPAEARGRCFPSVANPTPPPPLAAHTCCRSLSAGRLGVQLPLIAPTPSHQTAFVLPPSKFLATPPRDCSPLPYPVPQLRMTSKKGCPRTLRPLRGATGCPLTLHPVFPGLTVGGGVSLPLSQGDRCVIRRAQERAPQHVTGHQPEPGWSRGSGTLRSQEE